jgi:hypothetical protein
MISLNLLINKRNKGAHYGDCRGGEEKSTSVSGLLLEFHSNAVQYVRSSEALVALSNGVYAYLRVFMG